MRFIRFDYLPKEIDVTLKQRLLADKSGVLNFMIQGLQKLLTLREIPLGGAESREVHERFKTSNDPIGSFVRERCEMEVEAETGKQSLHQAFVTFIEDKNLNTELATHFHKCLYERFPQITGLRVRRGEERVQILSGIRIKPCL